MYDPVPAVVQQAEMTEQQLVERARAAMESVGWTVGQCAAEWIEKFAQGRTDADFAALIGSSREHVNRCRRTWERFGGCDRGSQLSWTHYREAAAWEDADECLKWAEEMQATVAEMKAWRRAQRGEDLTVSEQTVKESLTPDHIADVSEMVEEGTESKSCGTARNETPQDSGPEGVAERAPQRAKRNAGQTTSGGGKGDSEAGTARKSVPPSPEPSSSNPPEDATDVSLAEVLKQLSLCIAMHSEADRRRIAAKLRKLADKYDPRTGNGPTLEEVQEYVAEKGYDMDPEAFFYFYDANGWVQGKSGKPIKRWQSAVETWRRMRAKFDAPSNGKSKAQQRAENNQRAFDTACDELFGGSL